MKSLPAMTASVPNQATEHWHTPTKDSIGAGTARPRIVIDSKWGRAVPTPCANVLCFDLDFPQDASPGCRRSAWPWRRACQFWWTWGLLLFLLVTNISPAALAAVSGPSTPVPAGTNLLPFRLNVDIDSVRQPQNADAAVQILFAITLLSLAPSIILLMTSFTRIVIVLSFVRSALTLQGTPANQVIIGLSLFITFFIMAPVWEKINQDALQPYQAQRISGTEALENASRHIRNFMLRQARPRDVELFVALAKLGPTSPQQLPLKVVIPGFIISELRTAFQMGFLIFVPFILIDLVVATVLMSMGMMMMPPMTIALPLKILLFVLVDGWELVVRSVVQSFVP